MMMMANNNTIRKRHPNRGVHQHDEQEGTTTTCTSQDLQQSNAMVVESFLATEGQVLLVGLPHDSSRPALRRAGSSADDSAVSSLFDEPSTSAATTTSTSNDHPLEEEEDSNDSSGRTTKRSSSLVQDISNTLALQIKGVTQDFCKSGLPWEGFQCRSAMAGGSGILYALPALVVVCSNHSNHDHPMVEQCLWMAQAMLSVMADYFHIHHDSLWHGMDRLCAMFNLIYISYRAWSRLNSWQVVVSLLVFPVACYVAANRAKNRLDLAAWHWCHCGWHVTGGPLAALVIYLLYACPDDDTNTTDPSSRWLQTWCR
jgi:hypothetical protein